jgi:peroxiredoxin
MLTYTKFAIPVIGRSAPDFALRDLQGEIHSLGDYRGRLTIVYFWSAECPASARADDVLSRLLPRWGERVVALPIASNTNESPAELVWMAYNHDLPVVLRDSGQWVADTYRAITTPHFFVVDERGLLRYRGALDDVTFRQRTPTRFYLSDAIEALLDGRDPDPADTQPYGCTIIRYKM